jgi:hypothetical protein
MKFQMPPAQFDALLNELCVVMGFCLSPDEADRLRKSSPPDVDAFTDAVIRAEGLDPYADIPLRMRRDVRSRVADHFRKAEEEVEE